MKIYFRGEYTARKPITIIVSLIMTSIGCWLAVGWFPLMTRMAGVTDLFCTICALLFILVWLGGGLFLLHKVATNKKTTLSITTDGVSYGAFSVLWKDISEMGVMQKYVGRKDLYCIAPIGSSRLMRLLLAIAGSKSSHSDMRQVTDMPISQGLASDQVKHLFDDLTKEILPVHTHLRIVGPDGN